MSPAQIVQYLRINWKHDIKLSHCDELTQAKALTRCARQVD